MFKAMLKVIREETGLNPSKVIEVSLVTRELFFRHGIGPARTDAAMDFVEGHCAELYLVQTDEGFCLIDFDADDYHMVYPSLGSEAYGALAYLEETARDLAEDEGGDDEDPMGTGSEPKVWP